MVKVDNKEASHENNQKVSPRNEQDDERYLRRNGPGKEFQLPLEERHGS